MTKANDLASLLDANGDVVSSALDNVPAAPTPSLSSLGIPNHDDITVDASGFAGIGESSPQKMLHITRNDSDGMIVLDANGVTTDHQICFSKNYGTGGTTGGNYWGIGVDGSENKLVFAYDPNAQASLAADAKMVLDSSGNLLVGKTASNVATEGAEIRSSGFTGLTVDGGAGLTIRRLTSDGELQSFFKDTTKVGSIGNTGTEFYIGTPSGSDGYIRFQSQGLVPCTSTGANSDGTMQLGTASGRFSDLYLSGGVKFDGVTKLQNDAYIIGGNATAGIRFNNSNDTLNNVIMNDDGTTWFRNGIYLGSGASNPSSPNHLDDYEEGTWTPTFVSSGGGQSVSYDVQKGGYIKIGRFVHFQLQLGTISVSGGSGYIYIGGLPFANDGSTNGANAVSIGLAYGFATTITGGSSVQIGTTELVFYKNDNSANVWSWGSLATGASSNRCWISGTYITS